jgi:mannosyltransferase
MAEARPAPSTGGRIYEDPRKGGRGGRSSLVTTPVGGALGQWWPLAALLVGAAALRLATLDVQSFWYDEAYVPVHTLHPSLGATLASVVHRENTPPLWYVVVWAWSRVAGTGEVALRLPSALAGVATVALAWGIGRELTGHRTTAVATAALVAANPLLVWYSQEARAYALFVALAALATWCWLRADATPTPGRLAAFAASAAVALATHYFAVFLVAPMCLWLLRRRERWRMVASAVAAIAAVGAALVPLALAQGGHGTQWIGAWALASRLEAIPQYYLTGYSGAPLGHGVELLVGVEIAAAVGYGLWRALTPREAGAALLALGLAACGVGLPLALVLAPVGADYLAPRNVVAAMVPLSAGLAAIMVAQRTGRAGVALAGLVAVTFAALSVDVALSPRLQRGDWRGLARAIGHGSRPRALTTVELGAAPLEYYLPPLRNAPRGATVTVSEVVETGFAPLRPGAGESPAGGFHLVRRRDVHGLWLYRFRAPAPRAVSEATLRAHVLGEGRPEVLIAAP